MKIISFLDQSDGILREQISTISNYFKRVHGAEVYEIRGKTIRAALALFIRKGSVLKLVTNILRGSFVCGHDQKTLTDGAFRKSGRGKSFLELLILWSYKVHWRLISILFSSLDFCDQPGEICIAIIPDETYGMVSVARALAESNFTLITCFSGDDFGCSFVKKDETGSYVYKSRHDWEPNLNDLLSPEQEKRLDQFFEATFDSSTEHPDYRLTYNSSKKLFVPRVSNKPRILIASHVFCDASSIHRFDFKNFEEWIVTVVNSLLENPNIEFWIKEHPSALIRFGEGGYLEKVLKKANINVANKLIGAAQRVNLRDFDLILSCNGSIIYEATYMGVPSISCSDGFVRYLQGVNVINKKEDLVIYLSKITPVELNTLKSQVLRGIDNNRQVFYAWHIQRKIMNNIYFDKNNPLDFWRGKFSEYVSKMLIEFLKSEKFQARVINSRNLDGLNLEQCEGNF
jgi:hypothetical protein